LGKTFTEIGQGDSGQGDFGTPKSYKLLLTRSGALQPAFRA
jgi:hypothetical protein